MRSQRTLTQLFTTSTCSPIPSSSESESEIVSRVSTRHVTDSSPLSSPPASELRSADTVPTSAVESVTAYHSDSEASITSPNRFRRTSSTTHLNSEAGTSSANSGTDCFAPATCTESTSALHGRNISAGRHSVDEPFLLNFDTFLQSRNGEKKDSTQAKEIVVDVSKFLYFANPNQCDEQNLLSRIAIRKFVDDNEKGGIGPSGVLTKLRRISMAIDCLMMSSEDLDTEIDVYERSALVKTTIEALSKTLRKDKSKAQENRLQRFARNLPELSEVSKFLHDPRADRVFASAVSAAQAHKPIPRDIVIAMFIVAGRIMLRYD